MDENKLKKLKSINYKVKSCCGMCAYSKFKNRDYWGICRAHKYKHEKHTDSARQLSIYCFGSCPYFKVSQYFKDDLGVWTEFL
jgi:hypothetical protein